MEFNEGNIKNAVAQPDLIKKYALNLLRRWYYIVGFFTICVLVGHVINRYSMPVYLVKARITTKKFSNKSETVIPGMIDPNFFLRGYSEVYEEIPLLKSPKRIAAAIDRVDFRVSYFMEGLIKNSESFRGYGFEVVIDTLSLNSSLYGIPIFVNYIDSKYFNLRFEDEVWNKLVDGKKFNYNESIRLGETVFRVVNKSDNRLEEDKFYFILNSRSQLISEYSKRLNIVWAMKGSSMLDLSIASELPDREIQFLKAYYQVVEEYGLKEKNENLDNTIRYIDIQTNIIVDSLIYYQALIDNYKLDKLAIDVSRYNVSSVDSDPKQVWNKLDEFSKKMVDIQIRKQYFDYLIGYFKDNRNKEVFAPSLIELNVPLAQGWISQYINAKLKEKVRDDIPLNPLLKQEDSLKQKLERNIYESIASELKHDSLALLKIRKEAGFLVASLKDVHAEYRQLAQYQRIYQLNQNIFDLFVRRKTEAAISKASTTSDYEIIDMPSFSKVPIRPNPDQNLMIAAAIGLILPIGLILLISITNKRILDNDDLLAHTQMPMVGNIAHSTYQSRLVMKEHPRSVIAESFRAVRANMKFLAANVETRSRTFLVTSSVGGEGKTFFSLNLSYTLANAHRDTIVVGADLRKPELGNYMKIKQEKGLSTYLAGFATIEEIIQHVEDESPDFIDSGIIPPNPSELLASERMKTLMDYLKDKYEYIIIDTPPIGLVSDAMELIRYSNYNFLIVRQGITEKSALDMVNQIYLDGKLKNCSVVFNDIKLQYKRKSIYGSYVYGLGYGGYGYGYYEGDNDDGKK